MFKLCIYIPASHLEEVKSALFAAGAGKIGDYDSCCWQCPGEGQFRPLAGSQPYLGQQGEVENVQEYRVEMVCEEFIIGPVVEALRQTHPYEEPAFDVMRLIEVEKPREE